MTHVAVHPTLSQLAQRIREESVVLAHRWLERLQEVLTVSRLEVFPTQQLLDHIPEVICEIADVVEAPAGTSLEGNVQVIARATELGELRHMQHASVHQLLREYRLLSTLLEEFIETEVRSIPEADPTCVVQALRRVGEAVRILQQHTVDTFVANYTQMIERQTAQLRHFSRLVSHEIRQPLAVLHVLSRALPVDYDDPASINVMDIFDRSVMRLADVTGKLERLARITAATDLSPNEREVDLTEIAKSAAAQLREFAVDRGVDIHVHSSLPVVRLDPARAELIFVNLIANGIKFADLDKPTRYVEIYRGGGSDCTVLVRDNGIGMARAQLQNVFREFVRAHAQREDEVRAWTLGLGLSIVRECMDHANGSVRVDSFEGKGTTFKLSWPGQS